MRQVEQPEGDKPERRKVSLYLAPDEIDALDRLIIQRRKETGRSPRRSHLIREAIHSWLKQQVGV